MDVQQVLTGAQEAMTVRRVFGDPIQADGVTIIPVADVGGGGGGGGGAKDEGGAGFGLAAHPAGVYVVSGGDAHWRPAIDMTRIIRRGQLVGLAAIFVLGPAIRAWLSRRRTAA